MASNPFDAFDPPALKKPENPFDAFDAPVVPPVALVPNAVDRAVLRQPVVPEQTAAVMPPLPRPVAMNSPRSKEEPSALAAAAVRGFYEPDVEQAMGQNAQIEAFISTLSSGNPITYEDASPYLDYADRLKLDLGRSIIGRSEAGEANFSKAINSPDFRTKLLELAKKKQLEAQGEILKAQAKIVANPTKSESYKQLNVDLQAAQKGDSPISDAFAAYGSNILGLPEQLAEGGWSTVKPILATVGTSILPQTRAFAPFVSAGVTGFQGYDSSLSQLIEEQGQKAGVDLRLNPEKISSLLSDPAFLADAQNEAQRRGLTDAFFAYLSARVGMNDKIGTGRQSVYQAGLGGLNELAGQVAQKGTVYDPGSIIGATIGEGVFEGLGYSGGKLLQVGKGPATPPAGTAPGATPPPAAATPPPVAPVVPPAAAAPAPSAPVAPIAGEVVPPVATPVAPTATPATAPVAQPVAPPSPPAAAPAPVAPPAAAATSTPAVDVPTPAADTPVANTPAPATPAAQPAPAQAPAYDGGDPRNDARFGDLDRDKKSNLRRAYQFLLEQQQKLAEMKAKNYKTDQKEAQIEKIKAGIAEKLGDPKATPAPAAPTAQATPTAAPAPQAAATPAPTAQAAPDTQTQPTPAPQATAAPTPAPAPTAAATPPQAVNPAPATPAPATPAPGAKPPRPSLISGLREGLAAIKGREKSGAPAPTVAPSGATNATDPRQDRRYDNVPRPLRQAINVLYNKVINDQKSREQAVVAGRSTKNLDDRIAKNKAEIERVLSNQPKVKPNAPVNPDVAPIDPMAADQTYDYQDTPAAPAQEQTSEDDPEVQAAKYPNPNPNLDKPIPNSQADFYDERAAELERSAVVTPDPELKKKFSREAKDLRNRAEAMRKADNEQAVRDSQGQARPINRDENGDPQANRPDDEEDTGDTPVTARSEGEGWSRNSDEVGDKIIAYLTDEVNKTARGLLQAVAKAGGAKAKLAEILLLIGDKESLDTPVEMNTSTGGQYTVDDRGTFERTGRRDAIYIGLNNKSLMEMASLEEVIHALTIRKLLEETGDIKISEGDQYSYTDIPLIRGYNAGVFDEKFRSNLRNIFRNLDANGEVDLSGLEATNGWERSKDYLTLAYAHYKAFRFLKDNNPELFEKKYSYGKADMAKDLTPEEFVKMYRAKDFAEFVAGVLLDKQMQDVLKGMKNPFKQGRTTNFFRYIIDTVARTLGISTKGNDLYEAAIQATVNISARNRVVSAANQRGYVLPARWAKDDIDSKVRSGQLKTNPDGSIAPGSTIDTPAKRKEILKQLDRGNAVVTPDGDVANHTDAGLAKRGFVSAFASETLSEADKKSLSLTFDYDEKRRLIIGLQRGNEQIGELHVEHKNGDEVATIRWSEMYGDETGKGYGSILYAEAGERVRRDGAISLEGDLTNDESVPLIVREKVFGKGSTKVNYRGEKMSVKEFRKVDPEEVDWNGFAGPRIETSIPLNPISQKLAADIKAASQGDPATLKERVTKLLDAWEREVLGDPNKGSSGRLLSFGPNELAAWAYRVSKAIIKTGIKFGAWSKSMAGKLTKQQMKDIWQRASAIARSPISVAKHFLDSRADKLWEYADKHRQSAAMRNLANLIFTRSGPDADATGNSIPQRIIQVRRQFGNAYSNILNRFATEFAKMDENQRKAWDKEFRRAVVGLDPLPPGEKGKAVLEFRKMMEEMLEYQREAGIDIGDAGEGYFPRIWSSKKIQENIQKFHEAAKEMYRRRDLRLLNKAIDEINAAVAGEANRKKELDRKAGRRIKPDAEYQQDARDSADEKIDKLQAEHDAKDEAHYQTLAEAWSWRAENGRLDEVVLNENGINEANAPDHADPRMFTTEEAALADEFMDDDIDKTVMRYVASAVKKSELARVFGENGKEFGKMVSELKAEGLSVEERKHVAKLVRQSLDVTTNKLEGFEAKFFDWANLVVVSGYLGLSYVNNLFLEPISYGIRTGSPLLAVEAVAKTWYHFGKELKRSINDSDLVRKHYGNRVEMAKAMDTALAETLGLTHIELDRIAQDSTWDFNADAEEGGAPMARWVTQRVLKANLMEQSERAKVAASVAIARGHLLNVARTFNGNSPLQKVFSAAGLDVKAEASARSMLREAGVADADHASFSAFVASLQGMNDADYMAAVTGDSREAKIYRQAVQRTSTGMAIQTDQSMKTEQSDTIYGKMLMQLMNYSYAYSNLVKDRMYDSALKAANPMAQISALDRVKYAMPLLAGGAMTVAASIATKALIASLFPSDSGDDWLEKEDELKVMDSASYAGMFGKKFEYAAKIVSGRGLPFGPIPEAAGRAIVAGYGAVAKGGDSDTANYNLAKSVKDTGVKPLVVGTASAINPALGAVANYGMRRRDVSDAIVEGLSGTEKPKKK